LFFDRAAHSGLASLRRISLASTYQLSFYPGLIIFDYLDRAGKAISDLSQWIKEGKIQTTGGETIVDTQFEDIPKTWGMLFEGGNQGKLITQLQQVKSNM
jgi:NADPH-dependent curcumin reductase CurA